MAAFAEYQDYDGLGLAELVARGEVTAEEVYEAASGRIEARNPAVNAVCLRLDDQADAALAAGLPDGPFKGVPILIKDLNAPVADSVLSNGSRFFADQHSDHDSELVARYRRAGLVICGKSSTPEFGINVSTEPTLFGATRNPWNPERTAGGSSGGAAAAAASGMVPLAHASDGGGSIRIPASCCGLFGLKPTRARNPMGPDRGEGWSGLAHEHVISRSVRDSAAMLDATEGADAGAPYVAPAKARPFLDEVGADPGRLKIALLTTRPNTEPVADEVRAAVVDSAKLLAQLGHEVVEDQPEVEDELVGTAFMTIVSANVANLVAGREAELGRRAGGNDLEKVSLAMVEAGRRTSGPDYAAAIQALHKAGRRIAPFFERYDVLLTPTLAKPPVAIGELATETDDMAAYRERLFGFSPFTSLFNVSGQPACTVPLHWSETGLPMGSQLVAAYGNEALLFRLAAQLESARPWFERRPA